MHLAACEILVPWPGIKPMPPTKETFSLNQWTAREVPSGEANWEVLVSRRPRKGVFRKKCQLDQKLPQAWVREGGKAEWANGNCWTEQVGMMPSQWAAPSPMKSWSMLAGEVPVLPPEYILWAHLPGLSPQPFHPHQPSELPFASNLTPLEVLIMSFW